jgi:phosphoribosylglycinamide formyltransferase-1
MPKPFKIAVLLSGGGTTLKNLIEYHSRNELDVDIAVVVSNNPSAAGLQFADKAGIPCSTISHSDFDGVESFSTAVFGKCRESGAELIVMGGFLRRLKIPTDFNNRVINIHPSLIPSFCGKGYYGSRVHQGVIDYGCKISGCTVHFVDDQYDHGPIIAQQAVPVSDSDDAQTLAQRVFEEECKLYPQVINSIAAGHVTVVDRRVLVAQKLRRND